ncbi:fasciclin domain-containing protein [Mucilaginibacter sp. HMF5004]|uniref:fasciclin domain-containing protein n=1 Tax=Mucilaginibacter rivuli TaxID=2857527 RepID=UPI001C5D13D4|nr:fasciclin domain-containing protein [Mucilaginibacter rivuli]MBW4889628.1 fasciclin domain-containing protein [Mucilaginibacter rivuli]
MKKSILSVAALLIISVSTQSVSAQTQDTSRKTTTVTTTTTVKTDSIGDVVRTLLSNPDYSTAAAAAKAGNLSASVSGAGPYTIFAPNNAAFAKLPADAQDNLMKDTTKLSGILKTHVVAGKYGKAEIIKALSAGKGKATLTTIDGQILKLSISPKSTLQLTDVNGNVAEVILYDLQASNGVVNGINNILMPANKQSM